MNYPQLLAGLFVGLICGLSRNPATAADLAKETDNPPVQACIVAAGDLNGDQFDDYAVSWPRRADGVASSVYIVYGDGTPFVGESYEGALRQRAAMILHGPAAVPFSCAAALRSAVASRQPQSAKKTGPSPTSLIGPPLQYRMVLLDPGPFSGYFYAHAIAPHGEVVGQGYNAQGEERACLCDENGIHDLGTLGGHLSVANDINASGQVVGYSLTGETDPMGWVHQAFLAAGDGIPMQSLGELWSSAESLNDKTQVVGALKIASGFQHAALFDAGSVTDLGALDGPYSFAYGINNHGQIVGSADTYNAETGQPATHSILYNQGKLHDLGSLGYLCSFYGEGLDLDCYEQSTATDINDRGQIAGYSTTDQGTTHAYLMSNGVAADLGTLGGWQSWAMAVNDSGQVVGTSLTPADAAYGAFLYDRGVMYDLNQLIAEPFPHPPLWTAQDINAFGQIAGQNYRLDPIYTVVAADREFAFDVTLGRQFDFAYWLDTDEVGICSGTKLIQVVVKIELNGLAPNELVGDRHILSQWKPVDPVRGSCADADTWLTATRHLPAVVQGKAATIRIRTRTFDKSWNPTLYLRHFAMH